MYAETYIVHDPHTQIATGVAAMAAVVVWIAAEAVDACRSIKELCAAPWQRLPLTLPAPRTPPLLFCFALYKQYMYKQYIQHTSTQ